MRKIYVIVLLILTVMSFNWAFADPIDLSVYTESELVELRNMIDIELSKRNELKENELYKFEFEESVLVIDNIYLTEFLEKPTLVLHIVFTNYSKDNAIKANGTFYFSAYQNGFRIYGTDQVDPSIEGGDWIFIKSGASVEFDRGFFLQDLSSPVEINIGGKSRNKSELLGTILIPIPTN